jgi:hypothetical protein
VRRNRQRALHQVSFVAVQRDGGGDLEQIQLLLGNASVRPRDILIRGSTSLLLLMLVRVWNSMLTVTKPENGPKAWLQGSGRLESYDSGPSSG